MEKKRHSFDIQLNSISETNNPTKVEVEFILHDFDVSWNNAFIKKETAKKALPTLEDCPIVAKYYSVSMAGADDDALGGHEAFLDNERTSGNTIIGFNTIPIGVFTEPAYYKIINVNGEEKEVVAGKGVLWASRYPNVVGLLKEWMDEGISVVSSMEILFDEYHVKDGVEEILNYVFEGHCILNSEDRGDHSKVYPAYDVSKLNRLVAQAIQQEKQEIKSNTEEVLQDMKFKKVFELSHSDIRSLLYTELSSSLPEEEYSYAWISDVYESNFIYNIWTEADGSKYYKVSYVKDENAVTVDLESKTEVMEKREWVEVKEVQNLQAQLEEKTNEVEQVKIQLNEAVAGTEVVKTEKEQFERQFNEVSDKLITLNSLVEELKPFKMNFEQEQYEKALSEKESFYAAKFEAVSGKEKLETEEVKNLIKLSVNENEEGKNAILQLNSILVDMVKVPTKEEKEEPVIRELASKREKLVEVGTDFDSRYSL